MDTSQLIESFGYLAVFLCVFLESGIIFGILVPLPGLSLLFTAGILAASGRLSLTAVLTVGIIAAVSGYAIGYLTGTTLGRRLFYSPRFKQLTPARLAKAEHFIKRYGFGALIIGRFVPFVHTVAPIVAGAAKMPKTIFSIANVLGGVIWVGGATLAGFYLGRAVPNAELYLIPMVVVIAIAANLLQKPLLRYISSR